ncbi:hypothetical protein MC885_012479 [Smutsia gigantea]|nr:hypothetical protein MC885_012479 [Smutsia gigantea]
MGEGALLPPPPPQPPSKGSTTVAVAIFPGLVAIESRMCSTRAKGQRGAPPTRNAGSTEFGFRFPAPFSSPPEEV